MPFPAGVIYYTVNGEKPYQEEQALLPAEAVPYEAPLYLELQEDTATYSFQFYCQFEDGTVSDIYKRDYILDPKGKERFSTTYVVSITGDEEKLFGYEEGIFVRGRQFDEYMERNPDVDVLSTVIPANYMSDAEVPVNAAVFDQNGNSILSQNCGLKIYGNWTRAKNQKSFRLIARYDYDNVNEFSYPFLEKLVSAGGQTEIDAFQRISFHNFGDDNGYAFIRTVLIGELARQSGFPDALIAESATVYVNGKYQGIYWLENAFDDRYFKEKYGQYKGEMVICEGALSYLSVENAETEMEKECAEEYNAFCEWTRTADLSDEENWAYICSKLDLENFARYMAIEYYIGNKDWPNNNVKVYQYKAAENEGYKEDTVFDGRYRYLLFDTDYGMGLLFLGWYGADEKAERLESLCEYEESAVLFRSLLRREEFRTLFVNSVLHLMSGSFSLQTVSDTLYEYDEKRYRELEYMMEETDLLKNSLWEADDNNIGNVNTEMEEILYFAEMRPYIVLGEIQNKWGYGGRLDLTVSSASEGSIFIGGLKVAESTEYRGYCLENMPVEIMFQPMPGVKVLGYYVNSGFIEGESVEFVPEEWLGEGDCISIEPVLETEPVESLVISAYHIRGEEDYVVLRNNGQTTLMLSDYALTDSEEDLSKGRLPSVELAPQEEYVVYGKKYTGEKVKNSTQVSFSWNREEKILLVHVRRGIVDSKPY